MPALVFCRAPCMHRFIVMCTIVIADMLGWNVPAAVPEVSPMPHTSVCRSLLKTRSAFITGSPRKYPPSCNWCQFVFPEPTPISVRKKRWHQFLCTGRLSRVRAGGRPGRHAGALVPRMSPGSARRNRIEGDLRLASGHSDAAGRGRLVRRSVSGPSGCTR